VFTPVPADEWDLPEDERLTKAQRIAQQIRAGLRFGDD
jgi:hypothetical protein